MREDNTIDIFTKKSLCEKEESAKVKKDLAKKRLLAEVDKLRADIEGGLVTGITLLGVSDSGYRKPVQVCRKSLKELTMMNYVIDSAKDVVINAMYSLERKQEQEGN